MNGRPVETDITALSRTTDGNNGLIVAVGAVHAHTLPNPKASMSRRGGADSRSTEKSGATSSNFNNNVMKICRYPCLPTACPVIYNYGHTGSILDVQFCNHDSAVLTAGGSDSCVFQFNCKRYE